MTFTSMAGGALRVSTVMPHALRAVLRTWGPRPRTGPGALIALLVVLLVAPAPATASIKHDLLGTIDASATPAYGSFNPTGLAFDNSASPSAGQLWVGDSSNVVIERFSASGVYSCEITGRGSTSGTSVSDTECAPSTTGTPSGGMDLNEPGPTIAVDQSNGDVYAVAYFAGAIQRFDATGALVEQIPFPGALPTGIAFDSAGDLLVIDSATQVVRKYDTTTGAWSEFASGTGLSTFSSLQVLAVDLDASSPSYGYVYLTEGWPSNVVHVLDSSGTFVRDITGTPSGSFGSPVAVGVDPASGDVYVGDEATQTVAQFDANGQFLGQTKLPPVDSFFEGVQSIAFDSASGNVYVGDRGGAVFIYGPGYLAPDLTISPATDLGPTSATLNGSVNPDGVAVTDCFFEWGIGDAYDNSTPCEEDPGSGSADVPVHADITGLTPGETYRFRLVASNANGSRTSDSESFGTPPPPSISGVRSKNLDGSSVDLVAQVDPEGNATTYRFEYGTSASYGNSVPVPAGDVGSGTDPVLVGAHLTGLSPDVTYHWRVVAENVSGVTASRDHTFIYDTGGSPLPDNRAYEQVTPVDKNGSTFDRGFLFNVQPVGSSDGDRVLTAPIQCYDEAEACAANNRTRQGSLYASERTPTGWKTRQLSPPVPEYDASSFRSYDPDSDHWLFAANRRGATNPTELVARLGDDSWLTIGPVTSPGAGGVNAHAIDTRASDDLSRVVFEERASIVDWPFDATFRSTGAGQTVLEHVAGGSSDPILVGVEGGAGSTDLISECGTRLAALSHDGRTVIVTADGAGCGLSAPPQDELHARIDESQTVEISEKSPDACTTPACQSSAPADALFMRASKDAKRVLFISTEQLTDDAADGSENLYLYDFEQPAGSRLKALSAASTGAPGLVGPTALSASGSRVYFVATGDLDSEPNADGESPVVGDNNLYLYERDDDHPDGRLVFVTSLAAGTADENMTTFGPFQATVTPDGRYLLLVSHRDLTGDGADDGSGQVYRYDAETGSLIRVSKSARGFNDDGDETGPACAASFCPSDALSSSYGSRTMSDDGEFVFFTSPAALTPAATDFQLSGTTDAFGRQTYLTNLYRWHDGDVALIADGTRLPKFDGGITPLVGTDASGRNVFFKTPASLSANDTDNGYLDVYTARTCTADDPCITPPAKATPCSGDACQGVLASPPAVPVAGTVSFDGPGSTQAVPRPRVRLKKSVRGPRFAVRVKVFSAGRITIRGKRVKPRSRSVSDAGTYKLRVTLTKAARRELNRRAKRRAGRRSIPVALRIGFAAPGASAQSMRVAVRARAKRSASGASK